MRGVWQATGVTYIVVGALEAMWFLISVLGVGVGALMSAGAIPTDPDDQLMAPVMLGMYAVWLVLSGIAAAVHVWGGIEIVRGRHDKRWLVWAGVVLGFVVILTCYCAPFGITASVLGLVALFSAPNAGEGAESVAFNPDPDAPGDAFSPPRS